MANENFDGGNMDQDPNREKRGQDSEDQFRQQQGQQAGQRQFQQQQDTNRQAGQQLDQQRDGDQMARDQQTDEQGSAGEQSGQMFNRQGDQGDDLITNSASGSRNRDDSKANAGSGQEGMGTMGQGGLGTNGDKGGENA